MKDGANGQQFRRFLPHRTAMAESKAFMRAIRAALGLAGTYPLEELKKPFVVARMVPNLDAPEIKQAVAQNYLQSMGMLFEAPAAGHRQIEAPKAVETVEAYEDEAQGAAPWEEPPEEPDTWSSKPGYGPADYDDRTPPQRPAIGAPEPIICSRCPPGDHRRHVPEGSGVDAAGCGRVQPAHLRARALPRLPGD